MGLTDRGVIQSGNWADIAVFDSAEFTDRGTTFEPNQLCHGMRHVLVNGTFALRDGELTDRRAGQVLRR